MRFVTLITTLSLILPFPLFADDSTIVIDAVQIEGSEANDEFIRLSNNSDTTTNLAGWKLAKKSLSKGECKESTLVSTNHFQGLIPARGTFLIAHQSYKDFYGADLDYSGKSYYLSNNTSVLLYDASGHLVDRKAIGDACDESIEDPNSDSESLPSGTYSIRINELLPDPEGDDAKGEWIELFNFGETPIDLSKGWKLRDAKTKKEGDWYTFSKEIDPIVQPGEYIVIERKHSGISLNNSNETITLLDPSNRTASAVSYGDTDEAQSFNWDGSGYRWSRHLTPGSENRLNNAPEKKEKDIPDKAYQNVPATFSAKGRDKDGEDLKYSWDFGDGHKSSKQKTTHTYEETGVFHGTLMISDGTEKTVIEFTVKVEKYPKRKISIVALSPNPDGDDDKHEWIVVKSSEKKRKIDLSGWSIATGSKKGKTSNHPIREGIVLKPGKELTLTRDDAKFSLPNKKGYVELRSPDGKTVQKVSYKKESGIKEDETYRKEKGKKWKWVLPKDNPRQTADEKKETETPTIEMKTLEVPKTQEIPETSESVNEVSLHGMSEIEERNPSLLRSRLLAIGTAVRAPITLAETPPRVAGTSTERTETFSSEQILLEKINELANQAILELSF